MLRRDPIFSRVPQLTRRRALQAAASAALVGPLGLTRANAQAQDTIVFALSSYPPSLRPWANTGTAAVTVKLQTLRGLLGYDAQGELRGELADSWKLENPTTWTISLREGAHFQDGEPVDSEAVRASFATLADEKSSAYFRARVNALLDKIETPDKRTDRKSVV